MRFEKSIAYTVSIEKPVLLNLALPSSRSMPTVTAQVSYKGNLIHCDEVISDKLQNLYF